MCNLDWHGFWKVRKSLTYVLQETPEPWWSSTYLYYDCGLGVFSSEKKLVWCWAKVSFRNFRLDILIPMNQWFNWVNKVGLKEFIPFSYLWIWTSFYWLLVTEIQALLSYSLYHFCIIKTAFVWLSKNF